MAKWRLITLKTGDQEEASETCKKVYNATVKEYRKNPVTPVVVKLVKIMSIRNPRMWVFILRLLNGGQKESGLIKLLKKRGWVKTIPFP